jgi:hypothetical protein
MTKNEASQAYIDKAKTLTQAEAEYVFSRMKGKWSRRVEDQKLVPLEAVALQLELEDKNLQAWRDRLSELREKHEES